MIKLDIPRYNVEIGTYCLHLKFNYWEDSKEVRFLINPEYGILNKRPDGWWYFTIYLGEDSVYTMSLYNIESGDRWYEYVSGQNLAKNIKNWIKWENKNYD